FAFKIGYNEGTNPLYNGNISLTQWRSANTDNSLKTYSYTYDALNRIKTAIDNTGNYNLTEVHYDKNGNITNLQRQGHINGAATVFGIMDNLTYNYQANSNKLIKVADAGNTTYGFKDGTNQTIEYTYDANGNMVKDLNKGIVGPSNSNGILYNHLNLPTEVRFGSVNKIKYIYDATGIKLSKQVITSGQPDSYTYYAGNYIYAGSSLKFFSHPEGYVEQDGTNFDYVYQYKDHLGNVRLSYSDADGNGFINASTEIIEENNYYPFGLQHKGYNTNITSTNIALKRKFGGKEYQDELGLDWYDITARNYDPALGRWMNVDPLAEMMRRHSPYNYAFNNPIFFIDPDGMMPTGPGDPPINTTSIAVTRKASSIWNSIKTIATNSPVENISLAKNSITSTLSEVAKVGLAYVNDGFSGAGNVVLDGIGENIQKTSIEENISVADATKVWTDGVMLDITAGIATEGFLPAISKATQAAKGKTDVYRAWGGDSKQGGFSWTTENPKNVTNFRDKAGLPSGAESQSVNSATFITKGTINNNDIILKRNALPLDGNKGGLPEILVDPKNVQYGQTSPNN
ncbi:RHS repeat-associated core domain-containing protein, partial [Paucihalobacter ruber]